MNPADYVHLIPRLSQITKECKSESLFCLYCVDTHLGTMTGWPTTAGVEAHLQMKHDVYDACAGVDFLVGFRMQQLLSSLATLGENVALSFARHLDSVDTVEDFLTDCGEEPWPEMELDE